MNRDHASVNDVAGTAGTVAAVTAAGVSTCSITNDTTGGGAAGVVRQANRSPIVTSIEIGIRSFNDAANHSQ
jgi:hypothetical protein